MMSASGESLPLGPARERPGVERIAPLVQPYPISGASQRLRALAALSGSLTDALGPEDAAQLVERQALSALGATSAVVVTLGSFPASATAMSASERATNVLRVVHAIGLPAELRAMLDELPLEAPVPLAEVAREGAPLFLAACADR